MSLPAFGLQADLCIATLFFKFKDFGWSEKYILNDATSPVPQTNVDAIANVNAGVLRRVKLLGAGCSVTYARISRASLARDSISVITAPVSAAMVDPEVALEKINSVEVSAMIRSDDMAGKFALRGFRGLRDSWVTDQELASDLFGSNPDPDAALEVPINPATLLTPAQAVKNWLIWLKANTVIAKASGIVLTPWRTYPLTRITFRKVSHRDTGRPFGTSRGRAPTFS